MGILMHLSKQNSHVFKNLGIYGLEVRNELAWNVAIEELERWCQSGWLAKQIGPRELAGIVEPFANRVVRVLNTYGTCARTEVPVRVREVEFERQESGRGNKHTRGRGVECGSTFAGRWNAEANVSCSNIVATNAKMHCLDLVVL